MRPPWANWSSSGRKRSGCNSRASPNLEAIYTALTALLLGVWLCASLIHQFRFPWWQRIAALDRLHLLPKWTFFAPNPGRQDLHLLYRDWQADQPGSWQELSLPPQTDRRWRWLWNPSRYPHKVISDLVQGLLASRRIAHSSRAVLFSSSYLSLLAIVMEQPQTSPPACERQFAIAATQGFGAERSLELKFLSERHRVEP